MGIEAVITAAIIDILMRELREYTIDELTKAVSASLGKKISHKQLKRSIKRNLHRITIENGMIRISDDYYFHRG